MIQFLPFEQIDDYISIGSRFFPDADWGNAKSHFQNMFQKWSKGIIVFKENNKILGYVTLWPLTKTAFVQIEMGDRLDHQINADCIQDGVTTKHPYWILTAIAVTPAIKDERRIVIRSLLTCFKQELLIHSPCEILAHASTSDGLRFLLRTGFRQIDTKKKIFKLSYINE